MKASGLLILLLLISFILIITLLISYIKNNNKSTESFIDIPHDIKADYRDDVSEFLDQYLNLAQQVCSVQAPVIDGIAKANLGTQGGTPPTKQDLAAAQSRAKDMAGGPIFNCSVLEGQKAALGKDPLTIKDLYNVFDDIPDNVGFRFYISAKFSLLQLADTYKQIQGTLSSATAGKISASPSPAAISTPSKAEGFADMPQQQQPSRCKTNELCPDEMSQEILQRLPRLKGSLEQAKKGFLLTANPIPDLPGLKQSLPPAIPISDLLKQATEINDKLNTLKQQAQAGTLIGPTSSASATGGAEQTSESK